MAYPVLVIGDTFCLRSIRGMGYPVIGQELFKTIYLGLPMLKSAPWLDLLDEMEQGEQYSYLMLNRFNDLAEAALSPSAEQLTADVDPELRDFFVELYQRPEMTDPVWLSTFRIISSRMGREKHVVAFIIYCPIDNELIAEINTEFKRIADLHGIKNDYGFITPLDRGMRCVFEYDYYIDQTSHEENNAMRRAMPEVSVMLDGFAARTGTVRWIRFVLYQGFSRKEHLLYS